MSEAASGYAEKSASAILSGARISPRKANLLLAQIRGRSVAHVFSDLKFSSKAFSVQLLKLVSSAVANAENNHACDVDRLYVCEAVVGKGLVMKRMSARAKGRGTRIKKPFSNIRVRVAELSERV